MILSCHGKPSFNGIQQIFFSDYPTQTRPESISIERSYYETIDHALNAGQDISYAQLYQSVQVENFVDNQFNVTEIVRSSGS